MSNELFCKDDKGRFDEWEKRSFQVMNKSRIVELFAVEQKQKSCLS